MSNKTYFCTLKPISKFFFGGEKTFGEDGSTKTNYLVRSNAFPQQTTILGMLRFELLKQNNLLPISENNRNEVEEMIGIKSFIISEPNPKYGIIDSISPLFICSENEKFTIAPRDFVKVNANENNENLNFRVDQDGKAFMFGSSTESKLPLLEGYNHKTIYTTYFLGSNGSSIANDSEVDIENGVFISDSQIGIKINKDLKKDSKDIKNKGFYKQFYFRMNPKYRFGFYLNTTQEILEKPSIVFMGADKSAFELVIKEVFNENFETIFNINLSKKGTKITLLSDAFVSGKIYSFCDFAITNSVTFRNIETTITQNEKYHRPPKKSFKVLNLLARGSILYVNDLEKVKEILGNNNFRKIGYNIFKID